MAAPKYEALPDPYPGRPAPKVCCFLGSERCCCCSIYSRPAKCCGGCCCCLIFLLIIFGHAANAAINLILPDLSTIIGSWVKCEVSGTGDAVCSNEFYKDLYSMKVGVNGIPLGYAIGNSHTGYLYNNTELRDWDDVSEVGAELPKRTWSGEWWRGNELGFIVNNPVFWSGSGIWPASIGLGITMKQHAAVRPLVEAMFDTSNDLKAWIKDSAVTFLADRKDAGELQVSNDLQAWVHQLLLHAALGEWPTWEEALKFVDLQNKILRISTLSQVAPGAFYATGLSDIEGEVLAYIREWTAKLGSSRFADELQELGDQCSPSPNCTVQLASGIWDALYSAGGLSLPLGIQAGLGVFYSTSDTNPAPTGTREVPPGKAKEFFYECIRYFPPVYGVPFWKTRPTCVGLSAAETAALNKTAGETEACPRLEADPETGFPPVNQWQGGQRWVLNVGAAQHSKAKWGEDASTFVVRPHSEYLENFVGFAEMAKDNSVADGKNNRNCPAKQLAIDVGSAFFEVFKAGDWTVVDPNIAMDPFAAFVQIPAFVLKPTA